MSAHTRVFLDGTLLESQLSLQKTEFGQCYSEIYADRPIRRKPVPERKNTQTSNRPGYFSRIKQKAILFGVPAAFFQTTFALFSNIVVTALFVITAWFSQTTIASSTFNQANSKVRSFLDLDTSSTLTVLRILQGLLSTCSTFVLLQVFELLTWVLANKESGIRTLGLLGLSPTTGLLGTCGIWFSKRAKWSDRAGAGLKLFMIAVIWTSGILLFAKTDITVIYRSVSTYNVTAGVGPFRGSFVPEFLNFLQENNPDYNYTVLPYMITVGSSYLVANTMQTVATTPILCENDRTCHGFLLTGGLLLTTPLPPSDFPEHPAITISDAPVTQVDFMRGLQQGDKFDEIQDCEVFGEENYLIGIKFCLARSQALPGSLNAGLFVCDGGVKDGKCITGDVPAGISTTLSVYQRHATFTTARSNFSVLGVRELDAAEQAMDLDLDNLKLCFSWLFNFSAANIPGSSAAAYYFWGLGSQLNDEQLSIEPYQMLQSILAFPFWHFQENNYGNIKLLADNVTQGLAEDFYTSAAIGSPYLQIVVNRAMFITFCILQTLVISFVWVILIWLWVTNADLPEISAYPLIDFAMKTQACSGKTVSSDHCTGNGSHGGLDTSAGSSNIRDLLKNDHVLLRNAGDNGSGRNSPRSGTEKI